MERDGKPEGLYGREGDPCYWVVQAGKKRDGVLWIYVCLEKPMRA